MSQPINRRQAIGLAGVGAVVSTVAVQHAGGAEPPARKRVVRFLHLPETHIQPELRAPEGVAASMRHASNQADKPEFMLVAGDIIMDSMAADVPRTKQQWKVWKDVLKENWSGPVYYCLGDHDCWGLRKEASGATGAEPYYGKQMAFDELGIDRAYYSFDRGGWHFVVLDSLHLPEDTAYEGMIDDAQWEWFESDLASAGAQTPVVVHTHIPILTGAVMIPRGGPPRGTRGEGGGQQRQRRRGGFQLPEGTRGEYVAPTRMHTDYARFKDLFVKHPNVKLCLSGHLHVRERLEYNGVKYISNGAVCGNNWRGDRDQTRPGYGLVDLYSEGSFEERYVNFPWTWDEQAMDA